MLSACTSITSETNSDMSELIKCPEERPEMCTMQYEPVCANLQDNTQQTFSNGCSACSGKETIAYQQGECK
jgi:hypothetical protein